MNLKPIKTEDDYKDALKRLEVIFDAAIGTAESDEADIIGLMIDEYEKKHYPIEAPENEVRPIKEKKCIKTLSNTLDSL